MRQRTIGTLVAALLASLLLHAGLLAIVPRLPPSPKRPTPTPARSIEFEVVEVAPPPIPEGEETVLVPSPRRRGSPPPAPRSPVAPSPIAPPPASGTSAGSGQENVPGEPGLRATVLREQPATSPDLSPSWTLAGEAGGSALPATPVAPPPPEDRRLARRVQDMLVEDAPFRRAREAANPYWLDVKSRLARRFVVPAELLEERADGGFGAQTREAARGYLAQAKQYGETGNPEGPEIYAPHAAAIERIDEDLFRFQRSAIRRIEPGEDATRVSTWVRVVFAADGTVEQMAIERPSGLPAHDRLALEAAKSLPSLGPRPSDQSTTIWAFETVLWIVPPAPIVGCAFDATFIPTHCYYPLKRMIRSTVRLEAVE